MDDRNAGRGMSRRSFGLWNVFASMALVASASGCLSTGGETGPEGPAGADGTNGTDGVDGTDGTDGMNGADGLDATVDPALSTLEKAYAGVGGKDMLAALATITVQASGGRWVVGEGYEPEDTAKAANFTVKIQHDLAANGLRLDWVRDIDVLGIAGQFPSEEIMKDNLGVITGAPHIFGYPGGDMTSDRWASSHKQHMLLNPQLLLQKVAADESLATEGGPAVLDGVLHELLIVDDDVAPITLWVSAKTGKISKLTTLENDHVLRDVELEVFYEGWEPTAQGVRFPKEVVLAREGVILHQEMRDSFEVNAAIAATEFDFPAGSAPVFDDVSAKFGAASSQWHQIFAGIGLPLDGLQTYVAPQEVAPGVWWLLGGTHNTMVVEQQDGLVVTDAPLYNERSDAILTWTKTQFPTKPVKWVVLSHFHDDHTGGVRAFAAEGAKVVVGRASEGFIRHSLYASSTVVPDKLAMSGMDAEVVAVDPGAMMTLDDPTRPVQLFAIDSNHSADMVLPYLPAEKIIWVTDLYNAGDPPMVPPPFLPNAIQLHSEITQDLQLDVSTVITGHGGAVNTWAQFLSAIGM